ncbi:MAG: class I SAM-dependent methyltransferase [Pelolinea sp.]|nr:class I SAM-dependent methyltransferase [Pelolinea sp.]
MNKFLSKLSREKSFDYKSYWEDRYSNGGNSGSGSYGILATYKANFLNTFVQNRNIKSVIEFGCGDGNQLNLAKYPEYLGLDISQTAIETCMNKFKNDKTKSFMIYDPICFLNRGFFKADLTICLDVLYHIIPNEDFRKTLDDIFSCSRDYAILYTSLHKANASKHILHREMLPILNNLKDFSIEDVFDQNQKELTSAQFVILRRKHLIDLDDCQI